MCVWTHIDTGVPALGYGLAGVWIGLFFVGVHVFFVLVPLLEPHCAFAALIAHVKILYNVLVTPVIKGKKWSRETLQPSKMWAPNSNVHTRLTASSLLWKSPGSQGPFPLICLKEIDKYWKSMFPRKTVEFERFLCNSLINQDHKKPMLYRQFNWPALAFGGILMTPADKRLDSRSSTFFWLRLFSGGRTCGILMTPADKSLNSRSSTFTCGTAGTRGCGYKMGSSKMLRR